MKVVINQAELSDDSADILDQDVISGYHNLLLRLDLRGLRLDRKRQILRPFRLLLSFCILKLLSVLKTHSSL
jgi:hypothetical protein